MNFIYVFWIKVLVNLNVMIVELINLNNSTEQSSFQEANSHLTSHKKFPAFY
jgi:hypothetical protein